MQNQSTYAGDSASSLSSLLPSSAPSGTPDFLFGQNERAAQTISEKGVKTSATHADVCAGLVLVSSSTVLSGDSRAQVG